MSTSTLMLALSLKLALQVKNSRTSPKIMDNASWLVCYTFFLTRLHVDTSYYDLLGVQRLLQ